MLGDPYIGVLFLGLLVLCGGVCAFVQWNCGGISRNDYQSVGYLLLRWAQLGLCRATPLCIPCIASRDGVTLLAGKGCAGRWGGGICFCDGLVCMYRVIRLLSGGTRTRESSHAFLLCKQRAKRGASPTSAKHEAGVINIKRTKPNGLILPPPQFPPPRKVAVAIQADTFVSDYVSDVAPPFQRMEVYPSSLVFLARTVRMVYAPACLNCFPA